MPMKMTVEMTRMPLEGDVTIGRVLVEVAACMGNDVMVVDGEGEDVGEVEEVGGQGIDRQQLSLLGWLVAAHHHSKARPAQKKSLVDHYSHTCTESNILIM